MKTITVLIRSLPLNTTRVSEALRMGVGLTLSDDKVQVILLENGTYAISRLKPEIINMNDLSKHLETLPHLKARVIADQEDVEKRRINDIPYNVELKKRKEIIEEIASSDILIVY